MTDFRVAGEADDGLLRAMLRENGMPTWVEMTMQREPSFFAGKDMFGSEWAVLAEEAGEPVGMYTAAIVPVHVNGRPEQIGYLGGLRVRPVQRRRIRHLREGYASIRTLAPTTGSLPVWFTVVAAENTAARRLLEAGVPGLPAYRGLGDYISFGIPTTRARRAGLWRPAREAELAAMLALYNTQAARLQFAPVLDEDSVGRIGLQRFYVHASSDGLRGVAALWDQRAFKQIVARRYRAPIGALIPLYNAYARLFRRMPLPREGATLAQTFIAFLALADDALPQAPQLLRDLLSHCTTPAASLGLHAAHPLVPLLADLKPMRYPACVYSVDFERPAALLGLPAQPEAALL